MSSVIEKTFSGLVNSVFGTASPISPLGQTITATTGLKNVSLGLVNFVEKLQAARRISRQEEEHCLEHESREWVKLLSSPGVGSGVVADIMCRALIAHVRGFSVPSLHIHAIKLTQSPNVYHKKIGYLFVSESLDPGSELTLLLVNTIQRDLAAPNALEVAAALASLPTVLTPDLTPVIGASLVRCLAHQQVYIRRRAAAMVGVVVVRGGVESAGDQIPHLLHLLTDQDPGVALSATSSLAKIYKSSGEGRGELRDQVARSAANLLTQAMNGALPKDYQINALPAPFPQIQMLRVLKELSTKDWDVPSEVIRSLNEVLHQPWGGKEMGLYAVLLECVRTITALPTTTTTTALMPQVLKVVLGFLKSTNVDLKYVGVRAVFVVFVVMEDALTPDHLEAVMDCLYHSSDVLQASTLRLLCAMANAHNYQAVCTTLLEFSNRSSVANTQDSILSKLATILALHCRDVHWGVEFLSPLVLSSHTSDPGLTTALMRILEQGLHEEHTHKAAMESSLELIFKIFSQNSQSAAHIGLISFILNLHYLSDPKQVSKYFTDSLLEKLHLVDLKLCDLSVFQCLNNIGLNDPSVCAEIVALLQPYRSGCEDLTVRQHANEVIRWLGNPELSRRVLLRQEAIMTKQLPVDLTLSFLDEFVVRSLEGGGVPFKPLGVSSSGSFGHSGGSDRARCWPVWGRTMLTRPLPPPASLAPPV